MPFWYSFRFNFQIQFRYAPDTDAILILIQIQLSDTVQIRSRHRGHSDTHSQSILRYNSDTLQTRMPLWYSLRLNFQIQYIYAPDTDAILILIQIQTSDTIRIHSRHGCHSDTHSDSDFRCSTNTLQTQMLFWYSFRFNFLIHYNSDTLQKRMPFWYLVKINFLVQFRYAPDTDAILILI